MKVNKEYTPGDCSVHAALVDALEQFYNYMRHSKEDAPTQKWEEEFEDLEQIAGEALLKAGVLTDQD